MELNLLTDEDLVKVYSQGENKAFDVLLERYHKRIFKYIYLQIRDLEITKDIYQDTFVKAIVAIQQKQYTETGKFSAWLYRIAHNLIIDFYKESKVGISYSEDIVQIQENGFKQYEKSIEDVIFNEQVLRDVVSLLNQLPSMQQSVVRMRYFEGLSFNEIAAKTDVSVNTALGRMRYALINMRRMAHEHDVSLQLQ